MLPNRNAPFLIVLSGLPGAGKSSIARQLSPDLGAFWLRIDSIEQAVRSSGVAPGSIEDAGYRAAYAVARDNLRLGASIVADSVNPWMLTRNAWRDTGLDAGARLVEIEVLCSDKSEHRRRIEARASDIAGLTLPDWNAVIARDYHPWDRSCLRIDTARRSVSDCVMEIGKAISEYRAACDRE